MTFSPGSGYGLGTHRTHTITINDSRLRVETGAVITGDGRGDDGYQQTATAQEGTTYRAMRLGIADGFTMHGGMTVNLSITGSAAIGSDFRIRLMNPGGVPATIPITRTSGNNYQVAFPAGRHRRPVELMILSDGVREGTENIVVTVLPGAGYHVRHIRSTTIIDIFDN